MYPHVELERYGRDAVATRHRQAARHRLLRSARRAARSRAAHGPRGFRYGVARWLRSVAARVEPAQESGPAAA